MSYQDIGIGLKNQLKGVAALRAVFAPHEIPESINSFPTAVILPGEQPYHESFPTSSGVSFSTMFRIVILMSRADQPSGLKDITPFLDNTGINSIRVAIEGEDGVPQTLDGAIADLIVTKALPLGWMQWGPVLYLALEFEVKTIS